MRVFKEENFLILLLTKANRHLKSSKGSNFLHYKKSIKSYGNRRKYVCVYMHGCRLVSSEASMYILTLVLFSPLQNVQRSCNRRFKEKLPKKRRSGIK